MVHPTLGLGRARNKHGTANRLNILNKGMFICRRGEEWSDIKGQIKRKGKRRG